MIIRRMGKQSVDERHASHKFFNEKFLERHKVSTPAESHARLGVSKSLNDNIE